MKRSLKGRENKSDNISEETIGTMVGGTDGHYSVIHKTFIEVSIRGQVSYLAIWVHSLAF